MDWSSQINWDEEFRFSFGVELEPLHQSPNHSPSTNLSSDDINSGPFRPIPPIPPLIYQYGGGATDLDAMDLDLITPADLGKHQVLVTDAIEAVPGSSRTANRGRNTAH